MINIERFQCNMLGENCYVANDETNECIIVDCGAWFEEERQAVTDYIKENQLIKSPSDNTSEQSDTEAKK